jgi:hypothetical protein
MVSNCGGVELKRSRIRKNSDRRALLNSCEFSNGKRIQLTLPCAKGQLSGCRMWVASLIAPGHSTRASGSPVQANLTATRFSLF